MVNILPLISLDGKLNYENKIEEGQPIRIETRRPETDEKEEDAKTKKDQEQIDIMTGKSSSLVRRKEGKKKTREAFVAIGAISSLS